MCSGMEESVKPEEEMGRVGGGVGQHVTETVTRLFIRKSTLCGQDTTTREPQERRTYGIHGVQP